MNTYAVRIWEKAEHWYFDIKVRADGEDEVWKQLRREYPMRSYNICQVMQIHSTNW